MVVCLVYLPQLFCELLEAWTTLFLQPWGPAQGGQQAVGVGATRAECAHFPSVTPALHVIIFFSRFTILGPSRCTSLLLSMHVLVTTEVECVSIAASPLMNCLGKPWPCVSIS